MNNVVAIILYILALLVVGGLFGWLIAKLKMKRMIKKLDKTIVLPEITANIQAQKQDQDNATIAREVNQNERRRSLFRSYGDNQFLPVNIGGGKHQTPEPVRGDVIEREDERRNILQDTDSSTAGNNKPETRGAYRSPEEDWPDFS